MFIRNRCTMPSDFRQNGDNHEQLNIYYTSIIVKTRNKYNKFSKKTIKLPSISLPARIKKTIFLHKKFALSKNIPTFAIPFRESSFKTSGNSSVGRARPCQGRGREFESRFPLKRVTKEVWWPSFLYNESRTRDPVSPPRGRVWEG